jgi:hypothetical protein
MIKAFNKGRFWQWSIGDGRSIDEKLLDEYNIYLEHADDGNGQDISNNLKPLKSFDEWLEK